jgi:hypothetical protein
MPNLRRHQEVETAGGEAGVSARADWWRGLPFWLKLVFLLAALPAWLVIAYCIVTDQAQSMPALVAGGIFIGATLLTIAFDRRRGAGQEGAGGLDFGSGDD